MLLKSEKVMGLVSGDPVDGAPFVTFQLDPDPASPGAVLHLPASEFRDMDSPDTITVTVVPGDHLNDDAREA